MVAVNELLQLIYKKLDEILVAIKKGQSEGEKGKPKPITQKQFNNAMDEVMKEVNKK